MTAEVVSLRDGRAEAVAFQPLDGVHAGCPAVLEASGAGLAVGEGWLGRVVDPLTPKPWRASDGQVVDRHGLRWLIGYEPE